MLVIFSWQNSWIKLVDKTPFDKIEFNGKVQESTRFILDLKNYDFIKHYAWIKNKACEWTDKTIHDRYNDQLTRKAFLSVTVHRSKHFQLMRNFQINYMYVKRCEAPGSPNSKGNAENVKIK